MKLTDYSAAVYQSKGVDYETSIPDPRPGERNEQELQRELRWNFSSTGENEKIAPGQICSVHS